MVKLKVLCLPTCLLSLLLVFPCAWFGIVGRFPGNGGGRHLLFWAVRWPVEKRVPTGPLHDPQLVQLLRFSATVQCNQSYHFNTKAIHLVTRLGPENS